MYNVDGNMLVFPLLKNTSCLMHERGTNAPGLAPNTSTKKAERIVAMIHDHVGIITKESGKLPWHFEEYGTEDSRTPEGSTRRTQKTVKSIEPRKEQVQWDRGTTQHHKIMIHIMLHTPTKRIFNSLNEPQGV